jgi:hypothetical protein
VVEREPEARCWRGTGSVMERRGITELVESGRSLQNRGVQKIIPRLQLKTSIIIHHEVECRRVKKRVKIWWNGCEMSSNHGVFIGWWGIKFVIFRIFIFRFFGALTVKND